MSSKPDKWPLLAGKFSCPESVANDNCRVELAVLSSKRALVASLEVTVSVATDFFDLTVFVQKDILKNRVQLFFLEGLPGAD